MATPVSTNGTTTPCPFCNTLFKRVGNHLPYCKRRDGKEYSQYLAPTTLKCDKCFVRLDTHLRKSASCRCIPSPSIYSTTMPCTTPSQAYLHLPPGEAAMFLIPQNSNSAATQLSGSNETTNNIPTPLCNPKVKAFHRATSSLNAGVM